MASANKASLYKRHLQRNRQICLQLMSVSFICIIRFAFSGMSQAKCNIIRSRSYWQIINHVTSLNFIHTLHRPFRVSITLVPHNLSYVNSHTFCYSAVALVHSVHPH